jgi:Tol biopolymer transport system component
MKLVHEQSPRVRSWIVDWTSDGRQTVEIQQDYTKGTGGIGAWQIHSRDMNSGTIQKLADYYHIPHIAQALATSPDGRWIAYTGNSGETGPAQLDEGHQSSSLLVIPSAGGKVRELYRASPPEYVTGLDWSPDSSRILFGRSRLETGKERFQLSDVTLEDGKVRNLGLSRDDGYLQGLSVHPGGRQIAFTVAALGSREVRVLRRLSGVMVKR